MPETESLQRFTTKLDALDRARVFETGVAPAGSEEPIRRSDGSPVSLEALTSLKSAFEERRSDWRKPPESDRWLAPRFHSALRLTRAEAADKALWHWLAVAGWPDYVKWRWGQDGEVAENRWYGPVNKQALARLWWGGEIFRNGDDYSPVEVAFRNQDLVNSLLHRPVVRCRSLALGMIQALQDRDIAGLTSDKINDLARVLNLSTAGSPPEAQVGFRYDDLAAALRWAEKDPAAPTDWSDPLPGPAANDVTDDSMKLGIGVARHAIELSKVQESTD
jgi:hypothetical protein